MSSVIERPIKDEGLEALSSFFDTFAELVREDKLGGKEAGKVKDKNLWD